MQYLKKKQNKTSKTKRLKKMFNISCQHEIADLSDQKFNEKIMKQFKYSI